MCGIAGYFLKNNKKIRSNKQIKEMLESQKHRGPDDSGIYAFDLNNKNGESVSNNLLDLDNNYSGILGFNRLSIQDLSSNGHQPMSDKTGMITIAFNGEIYNANKYRDELISDGYFFNSYTDTEVILNLYLKFGYQKMIKMLNGMFAIVIVDLNEKSIYFGRDRFGIKPFYIYQNEDVFAFSSEIKSFYSLDGFVAELNRDMLSEYLLFRNNINYTLFKNVINLSQGHFIKIDANGFQKRVKYFDVNDYDRLKLINKESNLHLSIESLLSKSVQGQLVSDVKLGCQLSGGVDSSLITYEANRISHGKGMESVSIVFQNEKFSEEKYIDIVTKETGVLAHKFILDEKFYLDNILDATWHLDSPINHPNTIGILLLSEKAKKHVTVLLSGEGADEVFGGYARFLYDKFYKNKKLLYELRVSKSPINLLKVSLKKAERVVLSSSFMHLDIAAKLYPNFNVKKALSNRLEIYNELKGSDFDKQVKYEIKTYIPDLLMRQDKMSMAHSIENRVPFLDNEIVEWSFSQPEENFKGINPKTKKVDNKFQLKKYCEDLFGEDFSFRPKMGFGIPLKEFMNSKKYQDLISEIILPGLKEDKIFNYNLIEKWVKNINSISNREIESLWIISSFQLWKYSFNVQ
ncbi:MAG: asparagine synthase (glutamine-hydrolyzing) [Pelagibacterales bacterium]|nr:asparagine synthase (glutamine-hydrolyzing) [Pelagibacterales bacterium]|tara:strand:+ start:1724 stop:3622 length:1899 start_codon:yes stop_codon:yes gene_type:complete